MLRDLQLRRADLVSDLGIITPIGKPAGRGLKQIRETPCTLLAQKMKLKVHHAENFMLREQDLPPGKWDLIVAVSFGHKISSEVLAGLSAGGLNIHPSLLPKYRGPAPLHHALLNGDSETGVSLQTLHPTTFDRGEVLMRSSVVPITASSTLDSLGSLTARLGADLLKDLLLAGYPGNAPAALPCPYEDSYAPKILRSDMQVDWRTWTGEKITRWSTVLGTLWTTLNGNVVKLSDLSAGADDTAGPVGTIRLTEQGLLVRCADSWVRVGALTVAGKSQKGGSSCHELQGKQFDG